MFSVRVSLIRWVLAASIERLGARSLAVCNCMFGVMSRKSMLIFHCLAVPATTCKVTTLNS
eukprot:115880-Amphidinium_carterae.1